MTMGETIQMVMDDGAEIAVYHATPAGQRRGGLVLIQEIFGVTIFASFATNMPSTAMRC